MRQVVGLMNVISKDKTTELYNQTLSYASIHGAKLPSLQEILGVSYETQGESFDSTFDEVALKRLKERQAQYGVTTK